MNFLLLLFWFFAVKSCSSVHLAFSWLTSIFVRIHLSLNTDENILHSVIGTVPLYELAKVNLSVRGNAW